MTARDELDRVLGEWLTEGPTRAPDWPIDRAIEHARSHPRRPDPLGFLRAPVFPARAGAFNPRPALLLAAALLLTLVAAFVVGSRQPTTPVVVPPPSPEPTTSASPTGEPSPFIQAIGPVDLEVAAGQPVTVDIRYITPASGAILRGAAAGHPGDGASVAEDAILVANGQPPNNLVLTWSGMPCETNYRLEISADGLNYVLERPVCSGDAIAFDRVLVLDYAYPIHADQVTAKVQRAGATSQP